MKKVCDNNCKHIKCECGHCKDYHIYGGVCQQLDKKTLKVCGCKKFKPKTN